MWNRTGVPSRCAAAVRELDGDYLMRSEVARQLGVSRSTLMRWAEVDPSLGPHGFINVGATTVYVYRPADVQLLLDYMERAYPIRPNGLRTQRGGRPQMWTDKELVARVNHLRRVTYMRDRAELARQAGNDEKAVELLSSAAELKARMAQEHDARLEQVLGPRRYGDWVADSQQ